MQGVLQYETEVQKPRLGVVVVLPHFQEVRAADQVLELAHAHVGHVLADLGEMCYVYIMV